jgi:hypothetical protein
MSLTSNDVLTGVVANGLAYDLHGRFLKGIGYFKESIDYSYNPRGRLLKGIINNLIVSNVYYPDNKNKQAIYSNGDVVDYLYSVTRDLLKVIKNGVEIYPNKNISIVSKSIVANSTALINPFNSTDVPVSIQKSPLHSIVAAVPSSSSANSPSAWPSYNSKPWANKLYCVDCASIKTNCRQECSDRTLPTSDFGFQFFNCMNDCLKGTGC